MLEFLCSEDARRVAYRELFKSEFDADTLASIRDCTHKGWALGDTRFREEISRLAGRRAAQAVRGRPRKQSSSQSSKRHL